MKTAAPATADPTALPGTASLDEIERVATAGPRRVDGEQFALTVANVIYDVRAGLSGESVLAAIASSALPTGVRDYLVEDIDGQQLIRTERGVDTGLDLWIRSEVIGPPESPQRLNTEVYQNLISEPMDFAKWTGSRYDVAYEDGRWRLVDFSDASTGPMVSRNLTPAERRTYLKGPGWRRIPAKE